MSQAVINLNKNTEEYLLDIAKIENKNINNILEEAVYDYIGRYKETLEIVNNKDFYDQIKRGKEEVAKGIKGKSLNELDD